MSPVLQHLFPLLLCLTAALGYTHDGSCTPWCRDTFENLVQNGKVADPKNCYNYYICDNAQITTNFPFSCPAGEYFDPRSTTPQRCVTGSCDNNVNEGCTPECHYEAYGLGGIESLANRENCTSYFLSDGVNSIPADCPGGEYFNGVTCQLDPDDCCDPCLFYCGKAQTNIADPFDCQKYYYCQSADYFPDASDSHTCLSGQLYDPDLKSCQTDSSCSQLCH